MFADAVRAIDAGDVGALRALLAAQPELLHERLENGRDDYFARPYLRWFVAENPIRNGTLPANVVEITRALLEAGPKGATKRSSSSCPARCHANAVCSST